MSEKIKNRLPDVLLPAILLIYSLLLVNQGITVTDTGYNYSNFIHFSTLDPMWKFSTFLANVVGALFTKLPYGKTMLGLNFYTGLVKAVTAILMYFLCSRKLELNRISVFLAQLMALGYCWCPTALLYNYCTYLLFSTGALALCLAVKKDKKSDYFIAGLLLGLNVMVRLPNLAEAGLIAALWMICFFKKESIKKAVITTLLCIGGYVTGIIAVLGIIFCIYGPGMYINGILELLNMPSEAQSYSLMAMIQGDFMAYYLNLKWLLIGLLFLIIGVAVYCVRKGKGIYVKRILFVLLACVMITVFYTKGMFAFTYYNYDSMVTVGIVFLMIAGLMGLYVMFFGGTDWNMRMLGMVAGLIILISPLGSNNYLYTAENNLFLVTPFVFEFVRKWWIKKKDTVLEPIIVITAVYITFAFMQGVLFGATFVFRDGVDGQKRTEQVADNEVLKGIWTNPENAQRLTGLNRYIAENKLSGKAVILYDNVPSIGFYMNLEPVLSTTWPDLDSFSGNKFKEELEDVSLAIERTGNKPLIITGTPVDEGTLKKKYLSQFIIEQDYSLDYSDNGIYVYR